MRFTENDLKNGVVLKVFLWNNVVFFTFIFSFLDNFVLRSACFFQTDLYLFMITRVLKMRQILSSVLGALEEDEEVTDWEKKDEITYKSLIENEKRSRQKIKPSTRTFPFYQKSFSQVLFFILLNFFMRGRAQVKTLLVLSWLNRNC